MKWNEFIRLRECVFVFLFLTLRSSLVKRSDWMFFESKNGSFDNLENTNSGTGPTIDVIILCALAGTSILRRIIVVVFVVRQTRNNGHTEPITSENKERKKKFADRVGYFDLRTMDKTSRYFWALTQSRRNHEMEKLAAAMSLFQTMAKSLREK